MDLVSIGKFISELRKERSLTQQQLGEKIGVSNKTVSRWETGTYLPPADALMKMSSLFSVSINELLSGKRLSPEAYRDAAEENLKYAVSGGSFSLQDRVRYYKKKWLREHIAIMVFLGLIVIAVFSVGFVLKNSLIGYIAVLLLVVFHGVRNNKMMTYVEKRAFNGTGIE